MIMSVCVVGFGVIGSAIAATLSERGHNTVGIESDAALLAACQSGHYPTTEPGLADLIRAQVAENRLAFTADYAHVADADVIILAVGTPLGEHMKADLSHITNACRSIAPFVRDGQLIMVKSTVPPGVTRTVVAEILRERADVLVAFSPERLAEGQALRDLRTLPIVVGGVDAASTAAAAGFWKSSLDVDVIPVSSAEAAELVKLANNLWIDLNIALGHDLARVCDALPYPLDVLEVIAAANTLKKGQHYTNILTPSVGVGGYCLTKDPWFLHAVAEERGVDVLTPRASRNVNDAMPAYAANRIAEALDALGVSRSAARIGVLGLAFKSNSGDMRASPVLPFLAGLSSLGFRNVRVCDPRVDPADARVHGITIMDWERAVTASHCVAFLAGHDEFKTIGVTRLASLMAPGGVVFDGRYYFSRKEIDIIARNGLIYRGVGR